MFKIDMGKHALSKEEAQRGLAANSCCKVLGVLVGSLAGGVPAKGPGDNTWAIRDVPFRTHSLLKGVKHLTFNPLSEPGHLLAIRSLKEEPEGGVVEFGVFGLTLEDCQQVGRPIESKAKNPKPSGRISIKINVAPKQDLGIIRVPESFLQVVSIEERDQAIKAIGTMTEDEMFQIMSPFTKGNIREFVTDGREKAEESLRADWQDSQPTNDERADGDRVSIDAEMQSASAIASVASRGVAQLAPAAEQVPVMELAATAEQSADADEVLAEQLSEDLASAAGAGALENGELT
jgi:hypothetical protein